MVRRPADLCKGRDDCHGGGDKDARELEGDEKQDDREQIEQKFHRCFIVSDRPA